MGLSDTEIPHDARLVGICDAFDAMTSTRPYRKGMPIARALDIIESELGQQFDRALDFRADGPHRGLRRHRRPQ